jgi:hypothetical protein
MVGADTAASYALDRSTSVHDAHSLRLHNPTDGNGLQLQFFPAKTRAVQYTLSVWTKAETLQSSGPLELRLGFGTVGSTNASWTNGAPELLVAVGDEWALQSVSLMGKEERFGATLIAEVGGVGVLWLDLLQLVPSEVDATAMRP